MGMNKMFSGIYPAIISPVDTNGAVIEAELRALVRHFDRTDVKGLYVGGGTGEGILLSAAVRKEITAIIIDEVGKSTRENPLQVIVHVGAAEAENTRDLTLHAKEVGADAVSAIPPLYFSYSREKICEYYRWLASLTELPLIIYASAQAGTPITADIIAELSAVPTIKGIKFTGYNFYELLKISEVVPEDFSILNGGDEVLIFGLLAGADGGVGATYNVMPEKFCELYESWTAGDITAAKAKQNEINAIITTMVKYPVIGAVKAMVEKMGYTVGGPVFPNDSLTDEQKVSLYAELESTKWTAD